MQYHAIANTAYPINHISTFADYVVEGEENRRSTFTSAFAHQLDSIGLYVHIPFCQTRCRYCEYTVVDDPHEATLQDQYIDYLEREVALYEQILNESDFNLSLSDFSIEGIDIGGGTPTALTEYNLERVLSLLHEYFVIGDAQISIETTPRIAAEEPEKIRLLRELGCERISMGLQTTSPTLAKDLERDDHNLHNEVAVLNCREAGFEKLNIDLMYGFPDPSLLEWEHTVGYAMDLEPEYITLYRMRYKGTKMQNYASRAPLADILSQEELGREMLRAQGWCDGQIGKNTFSRIRHDSGASNYLSKRVSQGLSYLGMGLGAQSFTPFTLSYNCGAADKSLKTYFSKLDQEEMPLQDLYHMSREAAAGKFCSVSFYFGEISKDHFQSLFDVDFDEFFSDQVSFLEDQGLMKTEVVSNREGEERSWLKLTERGKSYYAGCVSQFYSPSIREFLCSDGHYDEGEEFVWTVSGEGRLEIKTLEEEIPTGQFAFGNILFSGPCNQSCPYCVGLLVDSDVQVDNLQKYPLAGIRDFIAKMNRDQCSSVILTATSTDPQLYRHEERLIRMLRSSIWNVHLSLHTNGQRMLQNRRRRKRTEDDDQENEAYVFNLYDSVSLSFPSFDSDVYEKMTGVPNVVDLEKILEVAEVPIKISTVVNEYNVEDIPEFVQKLAEMGIRRVALRQVLGDPREFVVFPNIPHDRMFHGNRVWDLPIDGSDETIEVTYWNFLDAEQKSLNLFADGTISDNYLITDISEAK